MFDGMRGVIEGFYGQPWSWEQRTEVMAWCHARGMTHYVYAPKDDPRHRARWRDLYPGAELAGFELLVEEDTLQVGFALSPGLSIDYASADDRRDLFSKVDQVVDIGIDFVVLALDDIPPRPGLGRDQAHLTRALVEHLGDRAAVVFVPTDYTSTRPTPYLDELATGLPADVPVAWTGPTVVCDQLRAIDALARTDALGGRRPLIWDNYPVNDALMGDRLFLGPLRGRDPELAGTTSGWFANPMVQPRASLLPLASVAAFLRGDDPELVWELEADELDVRVLADACDGAYPNRLVASLIEAEGRDDWDDSLAALRAFVEAAVEVEAGPLAGEAEPWVDQARTEAGVMKQAVRVLEALRGVGKRAGAGPDTVAATEGAMALVALWLVARRAPISVMGPRAGFRPILSQHVDGTWRFHRTSVQTDANATDRLVAHTLDLLDAAG
jgi:hypothetical protein